MITSIVSEDQFIHIMEKCGGELVGQDVGREHGIFTYERHGKVVGVMAYDRCDNIRTYCYSVPTYLYQAYIGERDE